MSQPASPALVGRWSGARLFIVAGVVLAATQLSTLYWLVGRLRLPEGPHTFLTIGIGVVGVVLVRNELSRHDPPAPPRRRLPVGVATGTVMFLCAVAAAWFANWTIETYFPQWSSPVGSAEEPLDRAPFYEFLGTVIRAPIIEEVLYRGLLLGVLLRVMTVWRAILVQAVVFAVAHGSIGLWFGLVSPSEPAQSLDGMLNAGLLGIGLAVIAVETGRLWPAMIAHAFNNATVASLRPELEVAGTVATALTLGLMSTAIVGSVLWHRDDFRQRRKAWRPWSVSIEDNGQHHRG